MTPLTWMQPRSYSAAARSIIALGVVAILVTIIFVPIQPGRRDLTPIAAGLTALAVVFVVAACWLSRSHRTAGALAWALAPLFAVSLIVELDLLTADASVAAQVFFFFPTLYGTSQLKPAGAIVMTAASVLGELIVVFSLMNVRDAVIDGGYVAAALVATAVLLTRSGQRQAELIAELERQAAIDPLTGLVTRRVLDDAAQSAMSGAASTDGTSLILLDVDDFKAINDRYGHPGGDEVLVQLAQLLVATSRSGDIVSRLGGDEIALLLPGCSIAALQKRAEQIVWDVRAHTFALGGGVDAVVSVSVGLAHAPSQAVDLRSLYVTADATLYEAKRSGRDRVGETQPAPVETPPAP